MSLSLREGVVLAGVARNSHKNTLAVSLRVVRDDLRVSDQSAKGAFEYG